MPMEGVTIAMARCLSTTLPCSKSRHHGDSVTHGSKQHHAHPASLSPSSISCRHTLQRNPRERFPAFCSRNSHCKHLVRRARIPGHTPRRRRMCLPERRWTHPSHQVRAEERDAADRPQLHARGLSSQPAQPERRPGYLSLSVLGMGGLWARSKRVQCRRKNRHLLATVSGSFT